MLFTEAVEFLADGFETTWFGFEEITTTTFINVGKVRPMLNYSRRWCLK
jgi:hypothetical protein